MKFKFLDVSSDEDEDESEQDTGIAIQEHHENITVCRKGKSKL